MKTSRSKLPEILAATGVLAAVVVLTGWYLKRHPVPVLEPAGPVAAGEKHLLLVATGLMLIVVVPVFIMLFGFAWRYRESNHKAAYRPGWEHSRLIETVWWLIPAGLILIIAVMTWHATYKYDPYKHLAGSKTMTIQAVALDWRWLFIYPDQNVASINQVVLPVNQPVDFSITADAPMNSFWLPALGGQIYAMPGMTSHLNLAASKPGTYIGRSANISGRGFSDMQFSAKAVSSTDFNAWVGQTSKQPALTWPSYVALAKPQRDTAVKTYSSPATDLFQQIVNQYMAPMTAMPLTSQKAVPDATNANMNMNTMHMEGM